MRKTVLRTTMALLLSMILLCGSLLPGMISKVAAAGTTDVTVQIIWNDGDDADGLRPNDVEVVLWAKTDLFDDTTLEGTGINGTVALRGADGWTYTWKSLPSDLFGFVTVYSYYVKGQTVDGYEAPVVTNSGNNWTITYNHTPTSKPDPEPPVNGTDVTVNIVWNDGDNADGLRPDEVEVELTSTFVEWGIPNDISYVHVKAADGWTYTWKNLPLDEGGFALAYSVAGYFLDANYGKPSISHNGNVWTLTYTHTPTTPPIEPEPEPDPNKVQVSVRVVWDDEGDVDGLRPESVKVGLVKDWGGYFEEIILETDVSGENGWTHTWLNLPIVDDGVSIKYSVRAYSIGTDYGMPVITNDGDSWTVVYTHTPTPKQDEVTERTVTIVWNDEDNKYNTRPNVVPVMLWVRYGSGVAAELMPYEQKSLSAANQWTATWSDLPIRDVHFGTFSYYPYSGDKNLDSGLYLANYKDPVISKDGDDWTITYTLSENYRKTDVTVSIVWDGDNAGDRPGKVEVTLYADRNEVETVELTAANQWSYTWTSLPEWNGSGFIEYTVEQPKLKGYRLSTSTERTESSESSKGKVEIVLKNTAVEEVSVTVDIQWIDLEDVARPTVVELRLYRGTGYRPGFDSTNNPDGLTELLDEELVYNSIVHLTADENGNWTYTWENLPKYKNNNADEGAFVYTVREVVPTGYSVYLEGDKEAVNGQFSFLLTNKACDLSVITINKNWDDADDQDGLRPSSISVDLYKRELRGETYTEWEFVQTLEIKAEDGWTLVVEEVLYFPGIEYKIQETPVVGYTTVITQSGTLVDGDYLYVINNKHTPEVTEYTVYKKWVDNGNQDGIRPEQITVTIKGSDGNTYTATFGGTGDDWSYTFAELPKYADGELITYTVESEDEVEGYTSDILDDTITNTHTPEVTEYTVYKKWADNGNQDGIRPAQITVTIKGSDGNTYTATFGGTGDDWSYTFAELPKYADGELITYTVESEDEVEGYTPSISGNTITNTQEKPSSPQTGDNSRMGLGILLMAISAIGMVVTLVINRKCYGRRAGSKN